MQPVKSPLCFTKLDKQLFSSENCEVQLLETRANSLGRAANCHKFGKVLYACSNIKTSEKYAFSCPELYPTCYRTNYFGFSDFDYNDTLGYQGAFSVPQNSEIIITSNITENKLGSRAYNNTSHCLYTHLQVSRVRTVPELNTALCVAHPASSCTVP